MTNRIVNSLLNILDVYTLEDLMKARKYCLQQEEKFDDLSVYAYIREILIVLIDVKWRKIY